MPMPTHVTATIRFTRQNAIASCVLYYVTGGAVPTVEQLPQMAGAVYDHFSAAIRGCIEPTTFFAGIDLRFRSSDHLLESSSNEVPIAGAAPAADILPEEDAVVIQRRTGTPGRKARGRIFMPFVPENFALDSALTPAAIAKYQDLAAKMAQPIAPVEGGGPTLLPRQPSWSTSQFLPIIACRVLDNTVSRRDRRAPKRYRAISALNVG